MIATYRQNNMALQAPRCPFLSATGKIISEISRPLFYLIQLLHSKIHLWIGSLGQKGQENKAGLSRILFGGSGYRAASSE
jgi:hypothetical protein